MISAGLSLLASLKTLLWTISRGKVADINSWYALVNMYVKKRKDSDDYNCYIFNKVAL